MSKRRRVATWWFRRPDEIVAIPSTARGDEIAVFHGERRSAIQALREWARERGLMLRQLPTREAER